MRCIVCDLCDLVTEDIGCVWLDVKYFPKRKIFSSVWLHSKKYFGKYFLVFGYILENALENPFLSCFSHFLTFSQLSNRYIIKSNKTQILNTQQKKKKNHQIRDQPKIREQQNKNHSCHHNNNKKIKDQREQADWR